MFVFLVQRLLKFFDCGSGEDQLPIKALDTILRIAKSEAKIENWESYQHVRLSMFAHCFVHKAVKFDFLKTRRKHPHVALSSFSRFVGL